jgi:serine/threonine-protein kinase
MASIFKARDTESGATVALKIPHVSPSDVVFFERFRREEEIGQKVDHPNVVKVLAAQESRMYIAMEYGTGDPSAPSWMKSVPSRPEGRGRCEPALRALVYLHEHGSFIAISNRRTCSSPGGRIKPSTSGSPSTSRRGA